MTQLKQKTPGSSGTSGSFGRPLSEPHQAVVLGPPTASRAEVVRTLRAAGYGAYCASDLEEATALLRIQSGREIDTAVIFKPAVRNPLDVMRELHALRPSLRAILFFEEREIRSQMRAVIEAQERGYCISVYDPPRTMENLAALLSEMGRVPNDVLWSDSNLDETTKPPIAKSPRPTRLDRVRSWFRDLGRSISAELSAPIVTSRYANTLLIKSPFSSQDRLSSALTQAGYKVRDILQEEEQALERVRSGDIATVVLYSESKAFSYSFGKRLLKEFPRLKVLSLANWKEALGTEQTESHEAVRQKTCTQFMWCPEALAFRTLVQNLSMLLKATDIFVG